MMDQAFTLRSMADMTEGARMDRRDSIVRVIAVTSGKGGVGKTNSVANLAVALSRMGKKVMLLDADLGLGNLDVLLGLTPKYNIGHILRGEKTLEEVIIKGPADIMILPATSGIQEFTDLSPEERLTITSHLEGLEKDIDILIIDTGAGISNNVLFFNMAAHEIIVVVSPEPTSLTDAYALMKVLLRKYGERSFKLLVNTVKTRKEGLEVYRKISLACERFLNISVDYLGSILYDEKVPRAVINQRAVVEMFPNTQASRCYQEIAKELCQCPPSTSIKGGLQLFWRRILNTSLK